MHTEHDKVSPATTVLMKRFDSTCVGMLNTETLSRHVTFKYFGSYAVHFKKFFYLIQELSLLSIILLFSEVLDGQLKFY